MQLTDPGTVNGANNVCTRVNGESLLTFSTVGTPLVVIIWCLDARLEYWQLATCVNCKPAIPSLIEYVSSINVVDIQPV